MRPVAELFYEKEFGKSETISGLVGLIWQVRDDLSFDVGVRHALTNGHPVNEIRAGVSFGFFRIATRRGSPLTPPRICCNTSMMEVSHEHR